ncbi:hypothetical protein [Photobacterium kasasachensis]|uniref:hypothetical protein n=1 Tax=Photobacterium kasasachensis TaxID=2910240 RepID=UPI003D0AC7CC
MKQTKAINPYMYKLLIEKEMDDFSVLEARDELVSTTEHMTDLDEARRVIYRQILSFLRKGWLVHCGNGRDKRYSQTELFKQLSVEPKASRKQVSLPRDSDYSTQHCSLTALAKEKKQYEGELAITLGEVEEYQSLMERFPKNRDALFPLFSEAKERSAKLLGKMNALSNAIQMLRTQVAVSC